MQAVSFRKAGALALVLGLGVGCQQPEADPYMQQGPPGAGSPAADGGGGAGGFADVLVPDAGGNGSVCNGLAGSRGVPFATGGSTPFTGAGGGGPFPPFFTMPSVLSEPTASAATPPPPISGGTLLTTQDGKFLVAADPDRDLVYFVDNQARTLSHVVALTAGDEPGRLVEDAAGRIHVALRSGHAVATLTRDPQTSIIRRQVCDLPRGLAYDSAHDSLYVACAEGKLITMPASPYAAVTRSIDVGRDARDVMVRGDQVFVTHFRAAELVSVAADGTMQAPHVPPTFTQQQVQTVGDPTMDSNGCFVPPQQMEVAVDSTPTIAWRAIDVPGKGIAMLHQRANTGDIQVTQGGYGASSSPCGSSGIVQTSLTLGLDVDNHTSGDLSQLAVAVDMATDPDGALLAIVAPGNWQSGEQLQVISTADMILNDRVPADANSNIKSPACVSTERTFDQPTGQATAVTFASPYMLAVQQREPALISFFDTRTGKMSSVLDLQQPSRADTGHEMFHLRTSAGIACASCHAEVGDDAHLWTFHGIGARRTQTLRGGILGTEPFHWNGDMQDFPTLVHEVFVGRMSGFEPQSDQTNALSHWIDRQPELKSQPSDAAAALRGKTLFESSATGCTTCHSGAHLTNNQTVDVGTGGALQVPSLRGVAFRAPWMHDGCAPSLADRFGPCGGGDKHGHTSQLSTANVQDLVAYLQTL